LHANRFRPDGMNLTAAMINPLGTVTGDVDATGCDMAFITDRPH
jgi:hypothetical protein